MSEPYVGEIRLVPYNFAPLDWNFCDGSLLSIAEFEVLFILIGTTYGGDGVQTFALPDLRGRVAIHQGSNPYGTYVIGQRAGEESVTLIDAQIPAHSHGFQVSSLPGTVKTPPGNFLGVSPGGLGSVYGATPNETMKEGMVAVSGGSQPHENRQPYVALNYIISLFGIFPSQN